VIKGQIENLPEESALKVELNQLMVGDFCSMKEYFEKIKSILESSETDCDRSLLYAVISDLMSKQKEAFD
jgi:hypothetical protein